MRCLIAIPMVFLACAAGRAQTYPEARPSIRATGEATVTAKPDRAEINVSVVTEAKDAQTAASQNATKLDAVLRALKGAAGAAAEIKTVSYSLDPNYRYPKPGGAPELAGYTARNSVEVTTPDLDSAGKIIDAAIRAGANSVERLQFTLKEDQVPRAQALREATAKARAAADAMASALGVKIARVLLVEEQGAAPPPRPMFMSARAATSAEPSTPVAPGTIEVHASVTLTVEISQ